MPNPYDLAFIGLSIDMAGGVVLALSFMLKTPVDAADEAATRSGQDMALFWSAIFQRSEAWCGALLLAVGFLLELAGNFENAAGPSELGILHSRSRVVVVCLAVWSLSWLVLCGFRADAQDRFLEHVFASLAPEQRDACVPPESARSRGTSVKQRPVQVIMRLANRVPAHNAQELGKVW